MREDMGRIITERPRRKGKYDKNKKYGKSIVWEGPDGEYHESRGHSSSRYRQYGWDAKEFTDVLAPLYRWLERQVGRPWNKVYSEMCQVLDKRKLTHAHVLTHLFMWVEKSPVFKNGKWHSPTDPVYSFRQEGCDFYIHPGNGLLLKQRAGGYHTRFRYDKETGPPIDIKIDDENYFMKIEGIWYRCKVEKYDPYRHPVSIKIGHDQFFVVSKRQLGKKELKVLRSKHEGV